MVLAVGVNGAWIWIDRQPPRWDEAYYLTTSFAYQDALRSGGWTGLGRAMLSFDRERPPLVPALALAPLYAFGRSSDAALVVNLLALALLMLSVYHLARLDSSRPTALLAAVLVATYTGTAGLSRVFLLDLPHAALVAACLVLLVRTEGLRRSGSCLALGLAMGLGMLCRVFFPVFLAGPLVVAVVSACRRDWRGRGTWLRGVGLVAMGCLAVAAPWYARNAGAAAERSVRALVGVDSLGYGPADPLSATAVATYLIAFIDDGTGFVGGLLLFVALPWLRAKPARPRAFGLIVAAVLVPLPLFATLPVQDTKDATPILPSLAVLTAWGLGRVGSPSVRRWLIGGAFLACSMQAGLDAFAPSGLAEVRLHLGRALPPLILARGGGTPPEVPFPRRPSRADWSVPEILGSLARSQPWSRELEVAVVPDHAVFNANTLRYVAAQRGLGIRFVRLPGLSTPAAVDYRRTLLEAEFVLIKTGERASTLWNARAQDAIDFVAAHPDWFTRAMPPVLLPDGSRALVYTVGGPATGALPPSASAASVDHVSGPSLLGFSCEPVLDSGSVLLSLYWRSLVPVGSDYRVFVHLTQPSGELVSSAWDHDPSRGARQTTSWRPGEVIEDRGIHPWPAANGNGPLTMRVGLYRVTPPQRLRVTGTGPGILVDEDMTRAAVASLRWSGGVVSCEALPVRIAAKERLVPRESR